MKYLLVGLGGFAGAIARYLVSGWIASRGSAALGVAIIARDVLDVVL